MRVATMLVTLFVLFVLFTGSASAITAPECPTGWLPTDEGVCVQASSMTGGEYRVYLPLIRNGDYATGEIEFKVWRHCISGQVVDRPAKNLAFIASSPGLWVSGMTNVVGEGRVTGTLFTMYLGTDRQEAGEIWYDPNAEPFYLWYYDDEC